MRQSAPKREIHQVLIELVRRLDMSNNGEETSTRHWPVVNKALVELVPLLLRVVARSGNEAGVRGNALKRADDLVDIGVQVPENDSYGLL